jgi:hypothetical protein
MPYNPPRIMTILPAGRAIQSFCVPAPDKNAGELNDCPGLPLCTAGAYEADE